LKILVTGADGNVGSRLQKALAASGHDTSGTDIGDTDITSFEAIRTKIDLVQPELVVHCAALTNVDMCAQQPDFAFRVNAIGTQNVALSCARSGAAMAYISTNEVFDG
jgi:dTDP-4-dehydrorhamnose reductase